MMVKVEQQLGRTTRLVVMRRTVMWFKQVNVMLRSTVKQVKVSVTQQTTGRR